MRLKTFSAKSMAEVMRLVRAEMGEDAIIVATRQSESGAVRVTAAVDQAPAAEAQAPFDETAEFLRRSLDYHGVPMKVAIQLLDRARAHEIEDTTLALAAAADEAFRFVALALEGGKPLALIGPPGAGKTVTAAKLATRAALRGQRVNLITTDTLRAGAIQQLSTLASVLGIKTVTADSAPQLADALDALDPSDLTLIDTPGTNPFDKSALAGLTSLLKVDGVESIVVLPAGADARESAEAAIAFSGLGATRLIATRLDAARRFGGLVAAADAGRLAFTEAGTTPHIAHGLTPLNPVGIARLLLRDPHAATSGQTLTTMDAAE
jgi:flagellar biosynthesis protein FlhF